MPKITKEKSPGSTMVGEGSEGHYPYGTSLNFEDDLVTALGLDNMKPGDSATFTIEAFVEYKSEHSNEKESTTSVSLQLTSIYKAGDDPDLTKKMYGKS